MLITTVLVDFSLIYSPLFNRCKKPGTNGYSGTEHQNLFSLFLVLLYGVETTDQANNPKVV
jgi:hypothetical protein